MPTHRRLCPGCKVALIASPAVRCAACSQRHNQVRGSAAQRGYGSRWRAIRLHVIRRDPLCTICLAMGRVTPSTEADHVIPKRLGGSDDVDNLRGTCKSCNAGRR